LRASDYFVRDPGEVWNLKPDGVPPWEARFDAMASRDSILAGFDPQANEEGYLKEVA